MCRKVHVYIMRFLYDSDEPAVEVESASAVLDDSFEALFSELGVLVQHSHLLVREHAVRSELFLYGSRKTGLEFDQVECVADLHESVVLILRHDLAVLPGPVRDVCRLVIPWEFDRLELLIVDISDICLVRRISDDILEASQVLRKLLEILSVRIDYALCYLSRSVMDDHVRRICQSIAGAS